MGHFPKTQAGMDALLRINPITREYMTDSIKIHGTRGGFRVEVNLDINWESESFFDGAFAQLEQWGIQPGAAAQGSNQSQAARANNTPPSGAGAANSGGGCGVHGFANARPAFRGNGTECGAYSPTQQPWSRDKAYIMKNGEQRFYCASRW